MENKVEKSQLIEGLDTNPTDHEYDGIIELDNALPPWWLYMFYGTIIFSIIYAIMFFGMGEFNQQDELKAEYALAAKKIEAYQKEHGAAIDENSVVLITAADKLADGKVIYEKNCVACHALNGGGGVGPNFTDDYWMHGNTIEDVFKVVKYGVPEKGMIPWEAQLNPEQIQNVSSYILNEFTGKNVAGGKEPQGEKVN